ncbi:MAG TPA: PEP/pyruvate-binding domain-containing protein [Anaerolineaceae bacterium]|nr:PEP/pyruvate-binding domain-containing protein [Anaerolineaceae bacterium]
MKMLWLGSPECHDPARVGGKAASLSRLAAHYPVPAGFCLPAEPVQAQPDPGAYLQDLADAYRELGRRCGQVDLPVAVRSSAIDEDGQTTSFAGQHETYLNVCGIEAVAEAVSKCLASAHNQRALAYRQAHGLNSAARIAVLVQQLVRADVSAVVFSADPQHGRLDRVVINATWGLGESLVGGTVTPDLYRVGKQQLDLLDSQVNEKTVMTIACPGGTREVPVPRTLRCEAALNPGQIAGLAMLAIGLENSHGWPVDLECSFQGSKLYLLQCRPITTLQPGGVEIPARIEVDSRI